MGKIRAYDKERRRKAKRELSSARRGCAEAIERFDEFEAAMDTLRGALECVDIHTGELHRPEHVEALIEQVARRIESLGVGKCTKLAKYLRNRAPGLALAQKSVLPRLKALAEPWSAQAVSLACICWYLVRALHKRPARARYRALYRHLLAAYPDFTIADHARGVSFYWEHLGMLDDQGYRARWEGKRAEQRPRLLAPRAPPGGRLHRHGARRCARRGLGDADAEALQRVGVTPTARRPERSRTRTRCRRRG